MRDRRASLAPDERERLARRAAALLLSLPEVAGARAVLLFSAFGTEVPTAGLRAKLLHDGARVLLPFLTEAGEMEAAEVSPGEPLAASGYGPREPASRVPIDPAQIDLAIVPGLAFDRRGGRLGYGGGHYDRYLARLAPGTPVVGLAFSLQLVDRVPTDSGDRRVDLVVTDEGVVDARRVH